MTYFDQVPTLKRSTDKINLRTTTIEALSFWAFVPTFVVALGNQVTLPKGMYK